MGAEPQSHALRRPRTPTHPLLRPRGPRIAPSRRRALPPLPHHYPGSQPWSTPRSSPPTRAMRSPDAQSRPRALSPPHPHPSRLWCPPRRSTSRPQRPPTHLRRRRAAAPPTNLRRPQRQPLPPGTSSAAAAASVPARVCVPAPTTVRNAPHVDAAAAASRPPLRRHTSGPHPRRRRTSRTSRSRRPCPRPARSRSSIRARTIRRIARGDAPRLRPPAPRASSSRRRHPHFLVAPPRPSLRSPLRPAARFRLHARMRAAAQRVDLDVAVAETANALLCWAPQATWPHLPQLRVHCWHPSFRSLRAQQLLCHLLAPGPPFFRGGGFGLPLRVIGVEHRVLGGIWELGDYTWLCAIVYI